MSLRGMAALAVAATPTLTSCGDEDDRAGLGDDDTVGHENHEIRIADANAVIFERSDDWPLSGWFDLDLASPDAPYDDPTQALTDASGRHGGRTEQAELLVVIGLRFPPSNRVLKRPEPRVHAPGGDAIVSRRRAARARRARRDREIAWHGNAADDEGVTPCAWCGPPSPAIWA